MLIGNVSHIRSMGIRTENNREEICKNKGTYVDGAAGIHIEGYKGIS